MILQYHCTAEHSSYRMNYFPNALLCHCCLVVRSVRDFPTIDIIRNEFFQREYTLHFMNFTNYKILYELSLRSIACNRTLIVDYW